MPFVSETRERIDRKMAGLHLLAQNIGKNLEDQAKTSATWNDRTGNTRRSIHGGGDRSKNGATAYLAHGSMVGTYFEEGTGIYGPHRRRIVPKNAKALRFTLGGKEIFVKSTKGMRKQPVIKPTVERQWPEIQRTVRKYWGST